MKDNQKILKCILFPSMHSLVQIKRSIIYVVLKQTQTSTWSFMKWQIVSYHQELWPLRTIDWPEALTGKDQFETFGTKFQNQWISIQGPSLSFLP